MEPLHKKITAVLGRSRQSGLLLVVYALLAEALFIGFLYFVGFFTIETLLPTFVTVRFSLTTFFLVLIIATMLLALLGRFLDITFPWNITKKSPLLWLGIVWGIGILLVSLIKFPPVILILIIALLLTALFLFWHVFFEEK